VNAATLITTTLNRKDEWRGALTSAAGQTVWLEIIVLDDASEDRTSEMARAEFPSVGPVSQGQRAGYIRLRNLSASMAASPVIFSVDDDAVFIPNLISPYRQGRRE
jgi:glycosyltransferase involved in cell wall biosynthesis